MKIINVGIIGYGKMGKIYSKEIYKQKNFRITDILENKDVLKNPEIIKKFFKSKKISLIIIASPISTHFEYLKHALKAKKNIIIEKPLVENESQLKKLLKLNKNYTKKIMIHHNDVINFEKFNLINDLDNKNIKKIEMIYGKKESINSYKKPFFDWMPHPLSVIINFFGIPNQLRILYYSKKLKKKMITEKFKLSLYLKDFPIFINFSNELKSPSKKIIIYINDKLKKYDGYHKKNKRSVKLLLEKFYKTNKINEINKNKDVYELLFKIEKKLVK